MSSFGISSKTFWISLLAFFLINTALYIFIFAFSSKVTFNNFNYTVNAHHYFHDARASGGKADLLRILGQYDAQWYLKIASVGYPAHPWNTDLNDKRVMNGLSYAFFPLYPLLVALFNYLIKNVELSAFIISNLLMLANFASIYFIVGKIYSEKIAIKTVFLLFLFPFSIFYRSYFSEGLFLFILLWFSYFLIKKRWFFCAVLLGLLVVCRGAGPFMLLPFIYFLYKDIKLKKVTFKKSAAYLITASLPIIIWMLFCLAQTGNAFYFIYVRKFWVSSQFPLINNLYKIFYLFPSLPIHSFFFSQIDVLVIVFACAILVFSIKNLPLELWLISFFLWLGPLLVTDTLSSSRFVIISFPLFIYLSLKLNGFKYGVLFAFSLIGLFFVSLFFVNWYWIG